ncbi:MAG: hypothetical protein K2Y32_06320 [Candidatus Obscuribacterales bacterium]|nr:hypothetical protein [Candidatus Obscuribacterales bacterium]
MNFREHSRGKGRKTAHMKRSRQGAILPLALFLVFVGIAFAALTVDVMRSAYNVQILKFAGKTAALSAYSNQIKLVSDLYDVNTCKNNIADALNEISGQGNNTIAWHQALCGPDNGQNNGGSSAVQFSADKIEFPENQQDSNEFFLTLKVRREGVDALRQFFMPLVFALNSSVNPKSDEFSLTNPIIDVEVAAQPATRVGAGVSRLEADLEKRKLAGFAALPIALSNLQYAAIAQAPPALVTIELDNIATTPAAGHIKGALVNLSGGTNSYFGDAQGNKAVNDAIANLKYFINGDTTATPPKAVERGMILSAIDHESAAFTSQKANLTTIVNTLNSQKFLYMFPVIKGNPVPGTRASQHEVLGFALFQLQSIAVDPAAGTALALTVKPVTSIVMPNVCHSPQAYDGTAITQATAPFTTRVLSGEHSMSPKKISMVMAPSLVRAR